MRKTIIILFLLVTNLMVGQNLVYNGDFEIKDTCPVGLGQIWLANNWIDVVIDADYYNCGLVFPVTYPTNGLAYSGTGYVSFTTYGDSIGSAEAIGQKLANPLLPSNTYSITFAAKQVNSGFYSSNCGGVAVYGINDTISNWFLSVHTSQILNSELLALTNVIQDTSWILHNIAFSPTDTVKTIIFTNEQAPFCNQCVLIDAIDVTLSTGITELQQNKLRIHPNPSTTHFIIKDLNMSYNLTIYNAVGQLLYKENKVLEPSKTIDASKFSKGLLFIKIEAEGEVYTRKIIKQ